MIPPSDAWFRTKWMVAVPMAAVGLFTGFDMEAMLGVMGGTLLFVAPFWVEVARQLLVGRPEWGNK